MWSRTRHGLVRILVVTGVIQKKVLHLRLERHLVVLEIRDELLLQSCQRLRDGAGGVMLDLFRQGRNGFGQRGGNGRLLDAEAEGRGLE